MTPGTLHFLGMNPEAAYFLVFMMGWMFPTVVIAGVVAPREQGEGFSSVFFRWRLVFGLWTFIGIFTARFGWTGFLWTGPAVAAFLILALFAGTFNTRVSKDTAPARQGSRV